MQYFWAEFINFQSKVLVEISTFFLLILVCLQTSN